jgi:hypothetical protein
LRFALPFLLAATAAAQTATDDYKVYTPHPRLFLPAARLRLLKRERDRDSLRWRQFNLLVRAAAQMPEQGFASALYYVVTGDEAFGKRAVDWAVGPGTDLRQLALVYDWCQPVLLPAQVKALASKIHRLIDQRPAATIPARRDRVVAAIAIADDPSHFEEPILRESVEKWWRVQLAPTVADGRVTIPMPDLYPLAEFLHAIRDNLNIDPREAAPNYFKELPKYQILGNYPAPLASAENEYRIPVYKGASQPSTDQASLARASGLAMVSYDNNQLENQFLQGWLIQDRFLMQGTFGVVYEFMWANPYQPGLSYYQLPLLYHDKHSGALFVRSDWEEDASWFGLYDGEAQMFESGNIVVLNQKSESKPIAVGPASVLFGHEPLQFSIDGGSLLVVGLKPHHKYLVETDDEEMVETESDRVGTLVLEYPAERKAGVRIHDVNSTKEVASGNGGA